MLDIVLTCTCMILVLYYLWYYKIVGVKGPPVYKRCWPYIGHMLILLRCNTHELLNDVFQTFAKDCESLGGIMRCFIGPITFYWVTDPDDVLKIGKSSINKHSFYQFAKGWFGNGLLTASGSTWKIHKKLLSPGFSSQVLSEYLNEMNSNSREYITTLESNVGKGPFDPSSDIRLTTLKTVFATLMCTSFGKDEDFYKLYVESSDITLDCVISRLRMVFYHSDFIYKLSKISKTEQIALKTANKMVEEIINSRMKTNKLETNIEEATPATKTPKNRTQTLLDLLLELQNEGKMTMQEVKDEINTITTAALDTSSWVLNNTLVLLGSHQEVQDKVVEELIKVFGSGMTLEVNKQDLTKLVYLEAVIKEVVRLYPPGPLTARTLERPVQLSKYMLPEGSHCILSLYGVNRDPWWGEDRDLFRPERWFEREDRDLENYFAGFSVGRRSCIGKTYAMLSLKTMLAHIVRRYRVTADATKLRFKFDFVMKPVAGHYISIERR